MIAILRGIGTGCLLGAALCCAFIAIGIFR